MDISTIKKQKDHRHDLSSDASKNTMKNLAKILLSWKFLP